MLYEKFPRIPYQEAMKKYGTDKPDLRNPLIIHELTKLFQRDDIKFEIFKKVGKKRISCKSYNNKKTKDKPRSFFDNIDKWAKTKVLLDWHILL